MVWAPRPGTLDVLGVTSPFAVRLRGFEVCLWGEGDEMVVLGSLQLRRGHLPMKMEVLEYFGKC